MHALRAAVSRGKLRRRAMIAMTALALTIAALSGCGKSKAELDQEKAEADARYDAAVQAEQEREHKLDQADHSTPAPPAAPVPKISPALAAALRAQSTPVQPSAPVATTEQPSQPSQPNNFSDGDLHEMYQRMMGNLRNNLPHSDSTRFFDANMNRAHTAVCGSVDYQMDDGGKSRSKHQRFIATMSDALVDTDAPGVHATFERMASGIDCTPGQWRDSSQ